MNPIATHQPVLFEAVRQTKGAILELGAGDSSTPQIHEMTDRHILTIDDQPEWIVKYKHLLSERHNFMYLPTDQSALYYTVMQKDWGLVFIDSSTWAMRLSAIIAFKDVPMVVIHDGNYGRECGVVFGKYFKYWAEYQQVGIDIPTTIIASNKVDVRKIKINDAIKVAQSE
jgi:hypothetical protein